MKALVVSIVGILLPAISLAQASQPPQLPSVVVQTVAKAKVSPAFDMVGRIEATEKVELTARVAGVLEERSFVEGGRVDAGKVLFRIERDPYEIAVQLAEAELAGAKAVLKQNAAQLARTEKLRRQRAVSQADFDLAEANQDQAKAQVLKAEAGLRSARLELGYTEVSSPISGQVSRAVYSVGNVVGPESGSLASVIRLDPIYVELSVSEKAMIAARRRGIDLENLPVAPSLTLSDGSSYPHGGQFNFIDPEVDRNTDTIRVRATFPNPDGLLLPGQFVRVQVEQKVADLAIVVPQSSVQKDREGYFVLTVGRDQIVERQRIEVGDQYEGNWVVRHGLLEGQRIIVEGLQKAVPGKAVNAVDNP